MSETKDLQPYQIEYNKFVNEYQNGVTNSENVGEVISRLVQYFAEYNLKYASALTAFNKVAAEEESKVDENTGKPISSSKAKVMAAASEESNELIFTKVHIESIEQMVNAAKSLQRGLINEYQHMGLT